MLVYEVANHFLKLDLRPTPWDKGVKNMRLDRYEPRDKPNTVNLLKELKQ